MKEFWEMRLRVRCKKKEGARAGCALLGETLMFYGKISAGAGSVRDLTPVAVA